MSFISMRSGLLVALLSLASPAMAAQPAGVQAALNKPLPAFSASAPAQQVLESFARQAGLKLDVDWAALSAVGVSGSQTLAINLPAAPAGNALDALLVGLGASQPLAWKASGELVRISTQASIMGQIVPLAAPASRQAGPATRPAWAPANPAGPLPTSAPRAIQFDNVPLGDVIDYFRTLSGANFHVQWRSLEQSGVTRQTPITLRLSDVTIQQALDLVLDQASVGRDKFSRLYWVLDDAIVIIATGEALNNTLKTRTIDVTELLVTVPDFAPPRTRQEMSQSSGRSASGSFLAADETGLADSSEPSQAQLRQQARDNLVTIIQDSIGQDMWQPVGKGSIRFVGNLMVISQTPLGFKLMETATR